MPTNNHAQKLTGQPAASGIIVARAVCVVQVGVEISKQGASPELECKRFSAALQTVLQSVKTLEENTKKLIGVNEAKIFAAHQEMLNDPVITAEVYDQIKNEKVNAAYAVQHVFTKYAKVFEVSTDTYMQARAADLYDLQQQLLNVFLKTTSPLEAVLQKTQQPVVLVTSDLTPSETSRIDKSKVVGFITEKGGATSHATIIARTMGIPAVVNLPNATTKIKTNDMVVVDGTVGTVYVNPNDELISRYQAKRTQNLQHRKELMALAAKPAVTKNNVRVLVAANIGSAADATLAWKEGADKIGLFRTEFLYMTSDHWPTVTEQLAVYKSILQEAKGKEVVVRTLDIGGDKKLAYHKFPQEDNPFLGQRSIRFSLSHVSSLRVQLTALIMAAAYGKLAIMFPMIATTDEFRRARYVFDTCYAEVLRKNPSYKSKSPIKVGMMVELPAAALTVDLFAPLVDFFSVGTNDLIQYTMAADRMSDTVRYLYQPQNPAVLRLLQQVIQVGEKHNVPVSVCGEMAANLRNTKLLLNLGLRCFSVTPRAVLQLKEKIQNCDFKKG